MLSFSGWTELTENSKKRSTRASSLAVVLLSFVFLVALLIAPPVSAADYGYDSLRRRSLLDDDEFKWLSIGLGPSAYFFKYAEEVDPPLKSTESGLLFAAHGEIEIRLGRQLPYLRGRADFSAMNTNYDGSLQDGTPTTGKTGNRVQNFEGALGVPVSENLSLIAGYGMHKWLRRLGYDEYYDWNYALFGFRVGYRGQLQNDNIGIALEVTARPMLGGQMVVDFMEPAQYEKPVLKLKPRMGFRAELPVDFPLSNRWSLVVSPYYEYSAIGGSDWVFYQDSKRVVYIREPSSKTTQYGSSAIIALKF